MKRLFIITLSTILVVLAIVFLINYYPASNTNSTTNNTTQNNSDKPALDDTASKNYLDLGGTNGIKLVPIDESNQNLDFVKFKNELLVAVKQKDVEFLKKHTDDTIKYSFGLNEKQSGFLKEWGLDTNPNDSKFWSELSDILALGGTFDNQDKTSFTTPYVFSRFPEKFDAFQYIAVTDKNVKVYNDSDLDSSILGTLSYSIVKQLEPKSKSVTNSGVVFQWIKIETPSGQKGFIMDKYARSPIDYRANFRNINGTWKLTFFIAGD